MTTWPFQQVVCFSAPYVRDFVAPRCSIAYVLWLLALVLTLGFPLFAAFATDNFWIKEGTYYEQPVVKFGHELFVQVSGATPTESVGWSSSADLDGLLSAQSRAAPIVRSAPMDQNNDGKADMWRLTLELPTGNLSSQMRRVFLMAVFASELRERVFMRVSGLAILDEVSPFGASGLWARGHLRFHQRQPLRVDAEFCGVACANPLEIAWNSNWVAANSPVTERTILDRYAARNESLRFEASVPAVWDYTPRDHFKIELVVDIAPQQVHYVPSALEVLKYAWMQLFSFMVPTWMILRCVKRFAFDYQFVNSHVVAKLPLLSS